jgi:hypothetical protein
MDISLMPTPRHETRDVHHKERRSSIIPVGRL